MKVAWVTPYSEDSAIGKFSAAVIAALSARGHTLTVVSSDQELPRKCLRLPAGIELLHWSTLEADPTKPGLYDVIVYNIGDHFGYHCGVVRLIDRYPGICIFHDFYLVNLFLAWCASGVGRPLAHSMVASIYDEEIADQFWKRVGDTDFLEWSASHAPMTEWAARHALASIAHAPFYAERLAQSSAGAVAVIPLAYTKPARMPCLGAEADCVPETYAERIEPFLKSAVEDRPLVDALRQIGHTCRDMGVIQDDPLIQRIGSEFRVLFSGAPADRSHLEVDARRMDPLKTMANIVGQPAVAGSQSNPSIENHEMPPPSQDNPKFPSIRGVVRAALWRTAAGFTRPVLSRLRSYFVEPFYDLLSSTNRRVVELSESFDVLRARLGQIEERIGTLADQLGQIEERIGTLADQKVARDLAMRLAQLEGQLRGFEDRTATQLIHSNRMVDLLVNRNILILEDKIAARTPYGYLLAPSGDLNLAFFLAEGTVWEETTSRLLDLTLKRGMTFVDVGAHVGLHALHAARSVGPNGKVIAFEPTPQLFQLLQRSVQLNGLSDLCACINVAASSSEGIATLHVSQFSGHNSLYELGGEEKAEIQVRTAPLDSLLQNAAPINVIKIDV
jgi:FkbM family methyltransferase